MKKNIFLSVFLCFLFTAYAQNELKLGFGGGVPTGGISGHSSFTNYVELSYLFPVSDTFKIGPVLGFYYSFGSEIDSFFGPRKAFDSRFLPIGLRAKYFFSKRFWLGGDIGYALPIPNDFTFSGLYYSAQLGYNATNNFDIIAAYRSVHVNGISNDNLTFGMDLKIK